MLELGQFCGLEAGSGSFSKKAFNFFFDSWKFRHMWIISNIASTRRLEVQ